MAAIPARLGGICSTKTHLGAARCAAAAAQGKAGASGGAKTVWVWHLGTWLRGGLGSCGGAVGLDDLKGVFQPDPKLRAKGDKGLAQQEG